MNIFDSESLRLFIIFFVPGFISIKVYDLFIPSERRDFAKSIFEAVSFSCINFAFLYWFIIFIHSDNFQTTHPILYYFCTVVVLLVTPIIWPVLYSKVLNIPVIRKRTIHPIPKPWDYFFSKGEGAWVIIHLKDGRRVGGKYDTKSFTSSFPCEEQIYIEEVWSLNEEGEFISKVERTQGIIISFKDCDAIEFFT